MCNVATISVHGCPLARLGGKETGGMNVYVRELSRAMGRQSMTVDVYTRLTDPSLPEVVHFGPNVRVIHLKAGEIGPMDKNEVLNYLPEFVCNVRQFAQRDGMEYQYVHSHYWLSGWVGGILGHRWGVPHVTTFHTLARVKNRALLGPSETERRAEVEARIIANADAVVVSSEHERHSMTDLYGARRDRIHVVPPGIDLDHFFPLDRPESKRKLGFAGQDVVLAVGRMDPVKGFDVLLRAVALLPHLERLRLVLVGGTEDDRERDRLQSLAGELGIGKKVTFAGAVPQERLPLYYSAASVAVVPSHYESFGFVAAEALACGTPVVASKVGGLPTIVRDGENGLLVPWRRPEAFAERIERLLTDHRLLGRLSDVARASVAHLNWDASAESTIGLYHALGVARIPELVCSCSR